MEFPDDEDIQFYATGFIDYDESLNSFDIFDHCALQLEGSDCSEVKLGIRVCALLDLGDNGRCYFDTMVESVMTCNGVVIKGGFQWWWRWRWGGRMVVIEKG